MRSKSHPALNATSQWKAYILIIQSCVVVESDFSPILFLLYLSDRRLITRPPHTPPLPISHPFLLYSTPPQSSPRSTPPPHLTNSPFPITPPPPGPPSFLKKQKRVFEDFCSFFLSSSPQVSYPAPDLPFFLPPSPFPIESRPLRSLSFFPHSFSPIR